jgi:hypothetical protein
MNNQNLKYEQFVEIVRSKYNAKSQDVKEMGKSLDDLKETIVN